MIIRNNIVRPKLMSDIFSRNMSKDEERSSRIMDVNEEIKKAEIGEKKQKESYETPVEPAANQYQPPIKDEFIDSLEKYNTTPDVPIERIDKTDYRPVPRHSVKVIAEHEEKYPPEIEKVNYTNYGEDNVYDRSLSGKIGSKIGEWTGSAVEAGKELKEKVHEDKLGNVIWGGVKSAYGGAKKVVRKVEAGAEKGVKYYIKETSPGKIEKVPYLNPKTGKMEIKEERTGECGFSHSVRRFANFTQAERDRKAKAENLDLFYSAQAAQYREKIARSEAKSSQYGATVRRFGAPAAPMRTFSVYNRPTSLGGVASSSPMGGGFQPNRGLVLSSGFSQTPGLRAPSFGMMTPNRQEQQPRQQEQQQSYGKRPYSKTGMYSKKNPDYVPRQQFRYENIEDPNVEGGYYKRKVAKVPRI